MEVFGHVEARIKKLWKDLNALENMEESQGLSTKERVEMGRIHRVRKSYSVGRNKLEAKI